MENSSDCNESNNLKAIQWTSFDLKLSANTIQELSKNLFYLLFFLYFIYNFSCYESINGRQRITIFQYQVKQTSGTNVMIKTRKMEKRSCNSTGRTVRIRVARHLLCFLSLYQTLVETTLVNWIFFV